MTKRAKMSDVAKLAGVSTATVSRTLQNPETVKEETRQKVFKAIKALDYMPNVLARQLRRMETKTILVVVPNIENNVFSQIVGGIDAVANERGYKVLLGNTNHRVEKIYDYIDHFKQRQVDGMIVLLSNLPDPVLQDLANEFPIVVTPDAKATVEVSTVTLDNVESGKRATDHLLKLGHRRIAHISGTLDITSSQDRLQGYQQAIVEGGYFVDHTLIKEGDFTFSSGFEAMSALLNTSVPPTAVFCASDEMAMGAIKSIKSRGLKVPDDIAVVGFDNIKFSEVFEPTLTTMAQPLFQMGKKAMTVLIERINNEALEEQHFIYQAELIVRESCGVIFR
ncbi:LacI family repressor for deo operon, udp, cdd, tsx, nupC, and nupG [Pullulanibacillus pueri]|nr:LacI family DNA-binding transcriptional regulator [Pullulanibacillus pueri]MBM7682886.1 LacI family repressor for deo operon, udp, cdd, tsx, nupC, and nupG [Pullulanibacillus pueri]